MNKFYSFEGNFKKYKANNNLEDLTNWAKAIIQHRMENATTLEGFEIAVEGNEVIKSEDTYVIGKYVSKYITDTFQATGKVIDHDFKLVDIWAGDMTKEDVLALSFNDALQLSDEVGPGLLGRQGPGFGRGPGTKKAPTPLQREGLLRSGYG